MLCCLDVSVGCDNKLGSVVAMNTGQSRMDSFATVQFDRKCTQS